MEKWLYEAVLGREGLNEPCSKCVNEIAENYCTYCGGSLGETSSTWIRIFQNREFWELQKEILNEKFWPQQTETEFVFPREVCEVHSKPLLSSHLYIDTCWVYTKLIWSPKPLEQVNHFTVKLKTLIWVFEIIKVLNMAMRMNCVIL